MQVKMSAIVVATLGISFGITASESAGSNLIVGSTVDLTFQEVSPRKNVDVKLGNNNEFETQAGIYNWDGGIETFCIQLTDSIHEDQTVLYDIVAVPNVPRGNNLLGSARTTLINDLYARHFDHYVNIGWNKKRSAAFQIVLWEIRHETSNGNTAAEILEDLNIETGYAEFDSSNGVNNKAEELLDSLGGSDRETFQSYDTLVGLVSGDAQNHITTGSNPQAVPGALGLASGLGLLGLKRRKRRRG